MSLPPLIFTRSCKSTDIITDIFSFLSIMTNHLLRLTYHPIVFCDHP
jgi:hypothetical protein